MNITILRVGLAIQEKAYNVQAIVLSKAIQGMGYGTNVICFLDSIRNPIRSCLNSNITYSVSEKISRMVEDVNFRQCLADEQYSYAKQNFLNLY